MPEGGGSHEKGGWEIFEGESYQKKKKKKKKLLKKQNIFFPQILKGYYYTELMHKL